MNIFNTKLHILSQKLGGSVLKKNIDLAKVSSEEFNSLPDGEGCSDPHRVLFALSESLFLISLLTIFFSFGCSKSSEQAPINPITGTQNTIPSSFLSREEILAIPTQNRKVGSFQLGVKNKISFWIDWNQMVSAVAHPEAVGKFKSCQISRLLKYKIDKDSHVSAHRSLTHFKLRMSDGEMIDLGSLDRGLIKTSQDSARRASFILDNKKLHKKLSKYSKWDNVDLVISNKSDYHHSGMFYIEPYTLTSLDGDCLDKILDKKFFPMNPWSSDTNSLLSYQNRLDLLGNTEDQKLPVGVITNFNNDFSKLVTDEDLEPMPFGLKKAYEGSLYGGILKKYEFQDGESTLYVKVNAQSFRGDKQTIYQNLDLSFEGCNIFNIETEEIELGSELTLSLGMGIEIDGISIGHGQLVDEGMAVFIDRGEEVVIKINLDKIKNFIIQPVNNIIKITHNGLRFGSERKTRRRGYVLEADPSTENSCDINEVKKRIEDLDDIDVVLSRTPYDLSDLVPNAQRHLTHDYLFLDSSGVIETFITTNKEFETYMYRSLGNL